MKIFEKIVAAVFWLQIVAAPSLLGVFLGIVVHYYLLDPLGWVVAIAIVVSGIISGILLANWAAKKYGTIAFISRVSATPELDNLEEKEK
jgi:hypothetical protein